MMKKYNIGLSLCILMLMTIVFIPNTVEAKKKSSSNAGVSAADTACSNTIYDGAMLDTSQDSNNFYVKVHAKEGLWNVKYYYGEVDEFDYSNVETGKPNGTFEYKGGTNETITIAKLADSQLRLVVIAELKGDTTSDPPKGFNKEGKILKVTYKDGKKDKETTCRPGSISLNSKSNFSISGTGAVITKVVKSKSSKQLKYLSEDEQVECAAMKQAKYKVTDTTPYLNETQIQGYISQMSKSFPYCDGASYASSYDITAKTIRKIRQSSLKAYKAYQEFLEAQADNDAYEEAEKEINDPSLGYELISYSANGIKPNSKLSCTKEQNTERTKRYYTRHTEVDGNKEGSACNVVCQEQIQVTYDPPVATKAGLCFQYKVTVKSKVTCKTSLSTKLEWPTPPASCSYSPICSGNEQETQAGPNDKFDACINTCDGGKYTQSCINSCYKKVYGSTSNSVKKTSTTDILPKVEKLAKSSKDPYYSNSSCDTNTEIQNSIKATINSGASVSEDKCVKFFYKMKQKYPMGNYTKAPSDSAKWMTHVWVPCWKSSNSGCAITNDNDKALSYTIDKTAGTVAVENMIESIKRSSPYYFRNKSVAAKTIQSLYGQANGYNGYGTPRKYNIDNGGIKRQVTSTYQCPEVCGFVQDDDNSSDCKNSDKEVRNYFTKAFNKITAQLENCTTVAKCKDSKEDENTFQITADNSAMKDATRKESQFESKNYTYSNGQCRNPDTGNIEMFIPLVTDYEKAVEGQTSYECNINPNGINGKCYGKDNPNYWQHYKTTITYPGTWINLKTAERKYTSEGIDVNASREKKNYYCTGYDFEPVNEQWWNWKVSPPYCDGNTGIPEDMSKIDTLTDKIDYNITASIIKFGKYNWSFDLNCFYGLSNTVCLPPPTCDDPCECENSTELCNATFRPITASKLFPGKNGDDREAGFNWTSDATDKSISTEVNQATGYGIDPGTYAKELQAKAQSNAEVNFGGVADYYIHLTKENIKQLRSYAKANGYTSFSYDKNNLTTPAGTYKQVNGIKELYYYNSNILENNKYIDKFERNVNRGVNNN